MTDDSGEVMRPSPVTLRQETFWWQKPFVALFLLCLTVTFVLLAAGSFLDRASGRIANSDLRAVASQLKVQYDDAQTANEELKQDNTELKQEQECRAQRNADLNGINAAIIREKSRLDVIVAKAVFERTPTAAADVEPYYNLLDQLADQSTTAEDAVRKAVEECRVQ